MAEGDLQRVFGEQLRRYRLARGLSQEALADLLGVHRTYMGGVERGERNLTLRSVERLCQRIGVEPLAMLDEVVKADAPADHPERRRGLGGQAAGTLARLAEPG